MGEALSKFAIRCQNRVEEIATGNLGAIVGATIGSETPRLMPRCPESSSDGGGTWRARDTRPLMLEVPVSLATVEHDNFMVTTIDQDEPVCTT